MIFSFKNKIVNKFLLTGDKYMPEIHLQQPRFGYKACRLFTKNEERIEKFKGTGFSRYIYQNELDKACFQHGMAYGDFNDLLRGTASDRVVCDKAFDIAENPKSKKMDISADFRQWFINFFIKSLLVLILQVVLKVKLCQTHY